MRSAHLFRLHLALSKAGLKPNDIDIVNAHATGTKLGDEQEAKAIQRTFGDYENVCINATKGFIGHCMGAAGALELAGNLLSFEDNLVHPTKNFSAFDDACKVRGLVFGEPKRLPQVNTILNNSSGMIGINTVLIVGRVQ